MRTAFPLAIIAFCTTAQLLDNDGDGQDFIEFNAKYNKHPKNAREYTHRKHNWRKA